MLLIAAGPLWAASTKLAWLAARATYTYRFEATGAIERRYSLPPRSFVPYDHAFTLGGFRFLVPGARLRITWGATHRPDVAARLEGVATAAHVRALVAELGEVAFDASRSAAFDDFIRRFVGNRNARPAMTAWWSRLQPPPFLWTCARADGCGGEEPISRVAVHEITSLTDGGHYREIRRRLVRGIRMSPPAPAPGARSGTGSRRPPR